MSGNLDIGAVELRRAIDALDAVKQENPGLEALVREIEVSAERVIGSTERLASYDDPHVAQAIVDGVENQIGVVYPLFLDVKGFTDKSEELGNPEKIREWILGVFEELTSAGYRYGAIYNKSIGDALLFYFGHPNRVENGAERAVQLALEWDKIAKLNDLPIRIGVTKGDAFIGNVGTGPRNEFSMIGKVVNRAARLESAAGDNEKVKVLVDDAVYDETKHMFRFNPKEIEAKGIGTIPAYEPLEKLDVPVLDEIVEQVFVGRKDELVLLDDRLRTDGSVVLIGDGGIGKTALLDQWTSNLTDYNVVRVAANVAEENLPLAGLAKLLKTYVGDDLKLMLERNEIGECYPALGSVLGEEEAENALVGVGAIELNKKRKESLVRLFNETSKGQNLVLVVDDWHNLDAESRDVLSFAVNSDYANFDVVVSTRPEGDITTLENYARMNLRGLIDNDAAEFLNVLGCEDQEILQSVDGNPFYLKELALAKTQGGEVSGSLDDKVMARVGYDSGVHALLRCAAVLGKRFDHGMVQQMMGYNVDIGRAINLGFVEQNGEGYEFKHELVREIVYGHLSEEDRQALHLKAAKLYEKKNV